MKRIGLILLIATPLCWGYELPNKDQLIDMENKRYEIKKLDRKCETVYQLAESIMDGRQKGLTLQSQMNIADNQSEYPFSDDLKRKEKDLIFFAYNIPKFVKDGDQFLVKTDFALKNFLDCRENGL